MSGAADRTAGLSRSCGMRWGTIAVAVLFIAVSIAVIVVSRSFPAPMTLGAPGPGRLPMIYAAVLIILSLGLIASALMGGPEPELRVSGGFHVVALAVWTAVYAFLLPYLGFVMLTIPWLFVACRLLGAGWRGSLAAAVVLPVGIFLSFGTLLGVLLP